MKTRTLIILVLALGLAGAALYGWKEYHRRHPDTASVAAAFSLSAPALVKAFQDDENNANKQYNDKVIGVSGTVVKVECNDSTQTVLLDGQPAMGGVICQFEASHNKDLKSLKPGQAVVVKGVCTGILMDVVLSRCALDDTGH